MIDETSEDKGTGANRASAGPTASLPATDSNGAARPSLSPSAERPSAAFVEEEREINEHSERAARCACIIGQAMGLKSAQLLALHKGALLHDLGKTAVPKAILTKPGPLDDGEWQAMRSHPREGYLSLLERLPIGDMLDVVLYHHERYDGSGYPDGLRGEEIPILARIFAVADAYDAMISDRPYRKATAPETAREEIVRCAGTQFDPVVVDFFCQHFAELREGLAREEKAAVRAAPPRGRSRSEDAPPQHGEAVPAPLFPCCQESSAAT